MSWQVYVDSNLLGTGNIHKAAILGLAGGVWAKSAGFEFPAEEQKGILNAFKDLEQTRANGVHLARQKFFTLQCDSDRIYGKKGVDGCVLVKTKKAILVTVYNAPTQAAEATPIVEGLADYLKNVGY